MSEVIVERAGSLGRLRLNRPKALNAVTHGMVGEIDAALDAFAADVSVAAVLLTGEGERGLCAGGDLRGLYDSAGTAFAEGFWRDEYRLDARIAAYEKPFVAVMDGITMGGGVGLSGHARHRIVTERSRIAMPETGIGYLPDVGGTWLLPRAPGETGTYLGLSGAPMGAADAIVAGFADALVPSAALPRLIAALEALPPGAGHAGVRAVVEAHSDEPEPAPLAEARAVIDRCFAHDRVEDILAALAADVSDFAGRTRATLLEKSPSSLVLTLRLLRLGRASDTLEACLEREFHASLALLAEGDFREGIRAAVIDKDKTPRWRPPTLDAVDPARIATWLAPRAAPVFPDAVQAVSGRASRALQPRSPVRRRAGQTQSASAPSGRTGGTMTSPNTIAFIGLGNMGGPMAANLVRAGFTVRGFDLVPASLEAARLDGVAVAASVADAVSGANTVITMLPAGRHVVEVWSEIAGLVPAGTLLVDSSTVDVDSARKAHALAEARGCTSIDAPVSGGTGGARAGTLTFMAGGSEAAFSAAEPILRRMGKSVFHCGEAGAGQAAKICNNMILGISMIGVCEAFALGERLGLSSQALFDVASVSSGQCWSLTTYCPVPGPVPASPANSDYKPGFAAALMLKDLRLAQAAAGTAGAVTPLGAEAERLYARFDEAGHGGRDFSAIIHMLRGLSEEA